MPVTVSVDPAGLAQLTLDRPAKRNALDRAMLTSFTEAVAQLAARDDVQVVVVRGAGGSFCAGADIGEWVSPSPAEAVAGSELGRRAFDALAALPAVSVAVLEGSALGGGFELALACDLRVAADSALLGLPELGLGNLPSWGGTARLIDTAGLGVARHLLLTGELISGTRAAELNLVCGAHPHAQLDQAVDTLVDRLLTAEPTAVGLAKRVLAAAQTSWPAESVYAGYTAGLESSRQRKQDFLDRKAAARRAKTLTAADHPATEGTPS